MVTHCLLIVSVVAPARERGLKLTSFVALTEVPQVAPARERGLK